MNTNTIAFDQGLDHLFRRDFLTKGVAYRRANIADSLGEKPDSSSIRCSTRQPLFQNALAPGAEADRYAGRGIAIIARRLWDIAFRTILYPRNIHSATPAHRWFRTQPRSGGKSSGD